MNHRVNILPIYYLTVFIISRKNYKNLSLKGTYDK